jgi:DNA-directed RNA polymerase sigma subunit (sigma70/sigma32)
VDRVTSLPLFPTDDGWPYPEQARREPVADDEIDLDVLELRADPHAYADLTELEYFAVAWRYGLGGPTHSMKALAVELECTHAEARDVLGGALDKLRRRLRDS